MTGRLLGSAAPPPWEEPSADWCVVDVASPDAVCPVRVVWAPLLPGAGDRPEANCRTAQKLIRQRESLRTCSSCASRARLSSQDDQHVVGVIRSRDTLRGWVRGRRRRRSATCCSCDPLVKSSSRAPRVSR